MSRNEGQIKLPVFKAASFGDCGTIRLRKHVTSMPLSILCVELTTLISYGRYAESFWSEKATIHSESFSHCTEIKKNLHDDWFKC